jgi:hypothetical protein
MFSAHPLLGLLIIHYNEDADLALICLMKMVWAKLSNTIHCTQQFVLQCAADYHSGHSELEINEKFKSKNKC